MDKATCFITMEYVLGEDSKSDKKSPQ